MYVKRYASPAGLLTLASHPVETPTVVRCPFGAIITCGTPAASRLDFVQAIMDAYAPYTAKRPNIKSVSLKDSIADRAERPAYTALDCAKIKAVYGVEQKDWRDGLMTAMAFLMRDRKKIA